MNDDTTTYSIKEVLEQRFDRVDRELTGLAVSAEKQRSEDRAWRLSIETRLSKLEAFQWRMLGAIAVISTIGAGILATVMQKVF